MEGLSDFNNLLAECVSLINLLHTDEEIAASLHPNAIQNESSSYDITFAEEDTPPPEESAASQESTPLIIPNPVPHWMEQSEDEKSSSSESIMFSQEIQSAVKSVCDGIHATALQENASPVIRRRNPIRNTNLKRSSLDCSAVVPGKRLSIHEPVTVQIPMISEPEQIALQENASPVIRRRNPIRNTNLKRSSLDCSAVVPGKRLSIHEPVTVQIPMISEPEQIALQENASPVIRRRNPVRLVNKEAGFKRMSVRGRPNKSGTAQRPDSSLTRMYKIFDADIARIRELAKLFHHSPAEVAEKVFLREHRLWKDFLFNLEPTMHLENAFDERIWGNYFRTAKPTSANALLTVDGDQMRKVLLKAWKTLNKDCNGMQKCFFLLGSTTFFYGEEALHTGVLVCTKKEGVITYFYFESMTEAAAKEEGSYAPMNFVIELKRLPQYDRLHIIFGNQTTNNDCYMQSLAFIKRILSNEQSLHTDNVYMVKGVARGKAAALCARNCKK